MSAAAHSDSAASRSCTNSDERSTRPCAPSASVQASSVDSELHDESPSARRPARPTRKRPRRYFVQSHRHRRQTSSTSDAAQFVLEAGPVKRRVLSKSALSQQKMREKSDLNTSDSSSSSSSLPNEGEYPTNATPSMTSLGDVEPDEICYVEFCRTHDEEGQGRETALVPLHSQVMSSDSSNADEQVVEFPAVEAETHLRHSSNGVSKHRSSPNGSASSVGSSGGPSKEFRQVESGSCRTNGLVISNGMNGSSNNDAVANSQQLSQAIAQQWISDSTTSSPLRQRIIRHRVKRRAGLSLSSADHEVVRLISQHLTDMGLHTSARVLLHESGCRTDTAKAALFRLYITKGKWPEAILVLDTSSDLVDSDAWKTEMKFMILEQMYLELLIQEKRVDALKVLQRELSPICLNRSRLHVLSSYLMSSSTSVMSELSRLVCERRRQESSLCPPQTISSLSCPPNVANSSELISVSRSTLMDRLQCMVLPTSMLPPRRLCHLLRQATQFQIDRCLYHNQQQPHPILDQDEGNKRPKTLSTTSAATPVTVEYTQHMSKSFSTNDIDDHVAADGSQNGQSRESNKFYGHAQHTIRYAVDHRCRASEFLPTRTAQILTEHVEEVVFCAFSPSGYRLATGSKDSTVIIFDVDPVGLRLARFRHLERSSQGVSHFAWSPDSTRLAICGSDDSCEVCIWNVETGSVEAKISHGEEDSLSVIAWSEEGDRICCGGLRGQFYQCDNEGVVIDSWEGIRVQALQYYKPIQQTDNSDDLRARNGTGGRSGPNGQLSRSSEGGESRPSCVSGRHVTTGAGHGPTGLNVATDSDDSDTGSGTARQVLAADTHNRLRVYNFDSLTDQTLVQEDYGIMSFTLDSTKRYALLNMANQGLHLWDLDNRCLIRKYVGVSQGYYVVHSTFGGISDNFIASGSEDARIYIFHATRNAPDTILPTGSEALSPLASAPILSLKGHTRTVNCVSWNRAFPHLMASVSDDASIRLWAPSQMVDDLIVSLKASGVHDEDSLPPPDVQPDMHTQPPPPSRSQPRRPFARNSNSHSQSMSSSQISASNSRPTVVRAARSGDQSVQSVYRQRRAPTAAPDGSPSVSAYSSPAFRPTRARNIQNPVVGGHRDSRSVVDLVAPSLAVRPSGHESALVLPTDSAESASNSLLRRFAFPLGLANVASTTDAVFTTTSSVPSDQSADPPMELLVHHSLPTTVRLPVTTATVVPATHQGQVVNGIRIDQPSSEVRDDDNEEANNQSPASESIDGSTQPQEVSFRALSTVDELPTIADSGRSRQITIIEAPADIVQTFDPTNVVTVHSLASGLAAEITCEAPLQSLSRAATVGTASSSPSPLTAIPALPSRSDLMTFTAESTLSLPVLGGQAPSAAVISRSVHLDGSAATLQHHLL